MTGLQPPVPWRPLGDTGVHFWLLQRMAKTCGVNTAEAANRGDLDSEAWVDLVQRCRTCQWADGCKRWLETHRSDLEAKPPTDCVNASLLRLLAERQKP
ncbi:DUF6455 family protein [Marivita sp.]|uniref:DUF6455 family protein n=1 Tax=Marivita sp. TaxID=2003365 RepID=UPI003F6D5941